MIRTFILPGIPLQAKTETNLAHRASAIENKTAFPNLDTPFYLKT